MGSSKITNSAAATCGSRDEKLSCLHIGKFYPPEHGGMETFLRDLLEALTAVGVRCIALVHTRTEDSPHASHGPVIYRAKVWFSLAFAPIAPAMPLRLHRIIKRHKPALLHLHMPNLAAFWALLLPSARQIPWIVHWHADVPANARRWQLRLLYRLYRPLERKLLHRARLIIATSPPYLEGSEALKDWSDKCAVVPLGIGISDGDQNAKEASESRDKTGKPLRVLAIGRLSYYKGFDMLIRAVADTRGVTLDLIGAGEESQRLHGLVQELGVGDRVALHGQVTDREREQFLAACDCLCLPSIERTEAFGVVLLEAMAAAKACIATAVPGTGMSWVVQHLVTGIVVPPSDPGALSEAIYHLKNNPETCKAMGEAGKLRLSQHFRIEESAAMLLDYYRDVRAGRPHAKVTR